MRSKKIVRIIIVLSILFSSITCDQVTKAIARRTLMYNERIEFLHNHLTIVKVENTGAFLSMGNSFSRIIRIIALMIIPALILGSGIYILLTRPGFSNSMLVAGSFVIGGGIGNVYDRIIHGSVTDFLRIDFIIFKTGVFNFADLSIMTGLFIVLLDILIRKWKLNRDSSK